MFKIARLIMSRYSRNDSSLLSIPVARGANFAKIYKLLGGPIEIDISRVLYSTGPT